MKSKISCIIIILFMAVSSLFADEEESLRKELGELQKELENTEENFWKSKYKLIELKQNAKNELDELENDYDDLMKQRNGLKEELLARGVENKNLKDSLENYNMREADLYSNYTKIIDNLNNFANRNYPFTTESDLAGLDEIRNSIERKESVITTGIKILDYYISKIKFARSCSLERTDILTKNKIPQKGKKLRLGYIFYGYLTDDKENMGLLLRTGKVQRRAFDWFEDQIAYKDQLEDTINGIKSGKELSLLPMDVMQSNAVGKTYAERESFIKGFMEWFNSGGIVMYAIVFVLAYALYIIIQRIIVFRRNKISTGSLMECVLKEIENKNYGGALEACEGKKGPLPGMLNEVLTSKKISRDEAQNRMQEFIIHEVPKIEKHLPTLKSLGALAPLLGLLGTVTGMISLFDVITSYGTGDPKLLAGGIAEALVTTEFGLIVAIPVVLCHRILLNYAERLISEIEGFSITLLNKGWKGK